MRGDLLMRGAVEEGRLGRLKDPLVKGIVGGAAIDLHTFSVGSKGGYDVRRRTESLYAHEKDEAGKERIHRQVGCAVRQDQKSICCHCVTLLTNTAGEKLHS